VSRKVTSLKICSLKAASAACGVAGLVTLRGLDTEWTLLDRATWLWIAEHPDCTVESVMSGVRLGYQRATESLGRLRADGRITAVVPVHETHLRYAVAVPPVPPEERARSPFLPQYRSDEESST
jgi:hypothetical protein